MMILMIAIAAASVTFGQTKMSETEKIEAQLIVLEKQVFEAHKQNNATFFQSFIPEDFVFLSSGGVRNKAQIVKYASVANCEEQNYSLDNFQTLMVDKNSAMLTYKLTQNFVCSGKADSSTLWVSTLFTKRKGKWVSVFHQTTPARN